MGGVRFFLVAVLMIALPGMAVAKDLALTTFAGDWRGNAISENNTSVNFSITSRDIDVDIRPGPDGNLSITWRTLLRQKGNPASPTEVLKETTLGFVKTDTLNVWKANTGGDVYAGAPVSWAQIRKQTLTIYVMAISDAGDYDMQVYKRTLTGLNMELDFTAIRDGKVRRTAKGQLTLYAR